MRIDQKLYEAARLHGYLHCFRLVLGVQNLYEAVITSPSFHNPFEIGLMKRVRYTPNANMADHSDGPELVAWKRGQSVCDLVCFDYASCVVL